MAMPAHHSAITCTNYAVQFVSISS